MTRPIYIIVRHGLYLFAMSSPDTEEEWGYEFGSTDRRALPYRRGFAKVVRLWRNKMADINTADTLPAPPGIDPEDARMLRELLARHEELEDERELLSGVQYKAFTGMLERDRPLTQNQAAWVRGCYERNFGVPTYENLWSAGKVPTGRPVETPAVLRRENLPLRPPGRK